MNLKTGKKSGKMKQRIKEMERQKEEIRNFRKQKINKLLKNEATEEKTQKGAGK